MRKIAGVKRVDKLRMEELSEEVGVNEGLGKLVRNRLKWAGDRWKDWKEYVDEESGCSQSGG